jgi:parvulin-like peptidyl-prolyl isomerase
MPFVDSDSGEAIQMRYIQPLVRSVRAIVRISLGCLATGSLLIGSAGLHAQSAETPAEIDLVARVNQHEIDRAQFTAYFNRARQQEFYHRTPPEAELEAFRIRTINDLINRLLLQDEALRRGIEPDAEKVEESLQRIVKRYEGNPEWEANRDVMLSSLRGQLETGSRIEQLEAQTRDVGQPGEVELQAFYTANPEAFTEPRQRKVSLILLQVDPSSTQEVRDEALAEAQALVERLHGGEEFALLAEAFSTDPSAENGGSMGWLHEGLLNDQAEAALATMAPGDISDPVRVLEGYAVLQLEDVKEPEKHSLEHVRDRAIQLWQRDAAEAAWAGLIASLREQAVIEIFDSSLVTADQPRDA